MFSDGAQRSLSQAAPFTWEQVPALVACGEATGGVKGVEGSRWSRTIGTQGGVPSLAL